MRYFIELAYNGVPFHGWQCQPNATSVQETIETALSKILSNPTSIIGAGRTDAGVHARKMFAHFDSSVNISNKIRFLASLNSLIGPHIAVNDLFEVEDEAHARFDATKRTYKYFVTFNKNPFLNNLSWYSSQKLDIEKMNESACQLLGTQDFTSFAKLHSDVTNNICSVYEAKWYYIKDDIEALNFIGSLKDGIVFTISANRFLRNMVRAIVGTLVDVGRGKLSRNDFSDIIKAQNRCNAGTSMPAYGLYLWNVTY